MKDKFGGIYYICSRWELVHALTGKLQVLFEAVQPEQEKNGTRAQICMDDRNGGRGSIWRSEGRLPPRRRRTCEALQRRDPEGALSPKRRRKRENQPRQYTQLDIPTQRQR